MDVPTYPADPEVAARLVGFIQDAAHLAGCEILHVTDPRRTPLQFSIDGPLIGRIGVVCYASPMTACYRPRRVGRTLEFTIASAPTDSAHPGFWKDPFALFTTIVVGIDFIGGLFVGADPQTQDPLRLPRRIVVPPSMARRLLSRGWHSWERTEGETEAFGFCETIVGATQAWFSEYVRFESLATGLDPGHRQLLSERLFVRAAKQDSLR